MKSPVLFHRLLLLIDAFEMLLIPIFHNCPFDSAVFHCQNAKGRQCSAPWQRDTPGVKEGNSAARLPKRHVRMSEKHNIRPLFLRPIGNRVIIPIHALLMPMRQEQGFSAKPHQLLRRRIHAIIIIPLDIMKRQLRKFLL